MSVHFSMVYISTDQLDLFFCLKKSPTINIFSHEGYQSKKGGDFAKLLWPPQNMWTLPVNKSEYVLENFVEMAIKRFGSIVWTFMLVAGGSTKRKVALRHFISRVSVLFLCHPISFVSYFFFSFYIHFVTKILKPQLPNKFLQKM